MYPCVPRVFTGNQRQCHQSGTRGTKTGTCIYRSLCRRTDPSARCFASGRVAIVLFFTTIRITRHQRCHLLTETFDRISLSTFDYLRAVEPFQHFWIKGTETRLVKFVYNFFLPKILYISRMKPSLNRTTSFKLIVHGIELHAAFEEKENKQKNAKL